MNVFLDTVPGHNLIVRVVDCCQADECRVHVMLPGCLWKCLILHWRDSHIHSCLFFSWAISGSFLSGSVQQHTSSQSSSGAVFARCFFFHLFFPPVSLLPASVPVLLPPLLALSFTVFALHAPISLVSCPAVPLPLLLLPDELLFSSPLCVVLSTFHIRLARGMFLPEHPGM